MMNRNINNHFLKYALVLCLSVLPWLGLVFLLFPQNAHAMEPIYKVLKDTSTGEGKVTLQVWNSLINIANTFVVVVLIAVAFAQILRINVSTYGVKKILPALVFAIIAANFSFLFCRLLIDFSNAVLSIFFEGVGSAKSATMNSTGGVASFKTAFDVSIGSAYSPNAGEIFWFILGQMFKIGAAVIVLILAFLFLIRNWMLYFLVALGPFCLMAMVLPQTKSIFTQWWSNLAKWIFMPIPSVFWLWVGAQWFNAGFSAGIWLINYVFAGICLYLAISSPFKLGGTIMGQFGGIGKKVWGATAGAAWKATGGAAIGAGKQWVGQKYSNVKRTATNYAKDKNIMGAGTISRAMGRGRINQAVIERYFKKDEMQRKQRDLMDVVASGRWDKDKKMKSRLIAEAGETLVGDEWERDVYAAKSNAELEKQLAFTRQPDGSLRKASLEEIAKGKGPFFRSDGSSVDPKTSREDLFKESAAAVKEFQLRRKGGRNAPDAGSTELPSQIVERLGLQGDPRSLGISAIGEVFDDATVSAGDAIRRVLPAQASQIIASVAGHGKVSDILEQHKDSIAGLAPETQEAIKKSLEEMCDARDQAVTDIVAGGEEEIEKKLRGLKLISGGIASGKFGGSSNELTETLDVALKAIANKDMAKIQELPEFIRGAGMGMDSKNPANTELYLKKIQGRAEAMMAANTHLQSLNGVALTEARAKLIQNPDQYIADVGQNMRSQNKLNASANVTGQMVANNMAVNPAMQGVNLGAIGSSEHALKEVADSIQGLSEQMHGLSSGPLADPHNLSPSAVADKAEFMSMAKEVMKGAQQGAFAGGATAQSSLGDANTRRIFSEQLAKATATALGKTLKKAPLKVEMTAPKVATPSTTQPPVSPEQTPPVPPAEPPNPPEK